MDGAPNGVLQRVNQGDVIDTIDGQSASALHPTDLLPKLAGPVGTTHTIGFGCPGCAGFQGTRTLTVPFTFPFGSFSDCVVPT